jgi:hypothetical protein
MNTKSLHSPGRAQALVLTIAASLTFSLVPSGALAATQSKVADVKALACVQDQTCQKDLFVVHDGQNTVVTGEPFPSLYKGDGLNTGPSQLTTIQFTAGRTHNFKLKGAASVEVTPAGVKKLLLRRAVRPLNYGGPPAPPDQEDFLYLQLGEIDETVDPGTTGTIVTANSVITPSEGTELDIAVAPDQPQLATVTAAAVTPQTSVDTVVTVVQGSVTVTGRGAVGADGVSVGADQQLTVKRQEAPNPDNVQSVDANQVTSWIDGLPPTVDTPGLPGGQVGVSYSGQLAARGGQGDYTWTQTSGRLPDGLSLAADGTVSGTPTRSGRYTFSVQVSDSHGGKDSASYTVAITTAHTCSSTDGSPCAAVWMDRARYRYGDTPGMCYSLSEAGHVHITVTKPDGSRVTALDADDDGSGACFSLYVPTGMPAGRRQVHLDLSVDGSVVAGADTTYDVVSGTCGTTAGQHCTAIWTDKSRYQVGDTARICYSVPQPIYFQITDITADGQSDVLVAGTDDGTGGCMTARVTPPGGTERLQLDVVSDTGARESAGTTFKVDAPR